MDDLIKEKHEDFYEHVMAIIPPEYRIYSDMCFTQIAKVCTTIVGILHAVVVVIDSRLFFSSTAFFPHRCMLLRVARVIRVVRVVRVCRRAAPVVGFA